MGALARGLPTLAAPQVVSYVGAHGLVLGNAALAARNRGAAAERAEALRPVFAELASMTTRAAAAELDRRGVATPSGAPWSAMTVLWVCERGPRTSCAAE
jgi:hypothetical protein